MNSDPKPAVGLRRSDRSGLLTIFWDRFKRDRLAMAGLIVVGLLFLLAYLAPLIANDKPLFMRVDDGPLYFPAFGEVFPFSLVVATDDLKPFDFDTVRTDSSIRAFFPLVPYGPNRTSLEEKLSPPSGRHWLGTDNLGRDVLARLIHGTRISLKVGLVAVAIALAIGLIAGSLAGYYGGIVDVLISRGIEIVMCFPFFFLILTVIAFLPPNIYNIMIIIGITRWTGIARYARGEFLKLKQEDFAYAARALGATDRKIIFRHILPNSIAPVLVTATFGVANAILIEAALSFLGMGVQPPTPSWGGLLSHAQEVLDVAWWMAVFPGLAIFITVTAYNILGEGIRDAADPRIATPER